MPERRRIRIRGYAKESTPRDYQKWLNNRSREADRIPALQEWDGTQPWSVRLMSPFQDDQFEALELLRPKLKGRQRQVVDLLFENETNQSEIARILGMDQRDVAACLKIIAKKILKISRNLGVKRPDK